MEQGNALGQAKSWGPGGSWVQEKNFAVLAAVGAVGMAEHDDVDGGLLDALLLRGGGRARSDDVLNEDATVAEFDDFRFTPAEVIVVVAGDDRDGGDGLELRDERRAAHIARVEDVVDLGEADSDAGIEEIMCVRDKSEDHGWV